MEKLKTLFQKPGNIPVRLSVHLFRYLISATGGVLLIYMITALLISQTLYLTGVILPANAIEQSVSQRIAVLDNDRPFEEYVAEGMFDDLQYAVFDFDGVLKSTNMNERRLQEAGDLVRRPYHEFQDLKGLTVGRKISSDTDTLVVYYDIDASFSNEWMRKHLPSPGKCITLIIILLSLIWLIAFTGFTAKRLQRELAKLEHVTGRIAERDLEFIPEQTNVTEFNRILEATTSMRDALKTSLIKEWETESVKRRQINALVHDIKTPLTVVGGNAELLLESSLGANEKEYAKQIHAGVERIYRYVDDILLVSKDAHQHNEGIEENSIFALKDIAAEILSFTGKEKRLQLRTSIEEDTGMLPVTRQDVERILQNLLENAVRYAPVNSTIYFDVSKKERSIVICVSDEGPGFSEEALMYAGELFWQDDKSRTDGRHHGVGLASVKQIVSGVGGELRLRNGETKGACVEVFIPVPQ